MMAEAANQRCGNPPRFSFQVDRPQPAMRIGRDHREPLGAFQIASASFHTRLGAPGSGKNNVVNPVNQALNQAEAIQC